MQCNYRHSCIAVWYDRSAVLLFVDADQPLDIALVVVTVNLYDYIIALVKLLS